VNVTRVDAVKCQRQRSVQSMAVYLNHHVFDRTLEHAVEPDRRLEVTHGACVGVVKKRSEHNKSEQHNESIEHV
jgi:hypothetical protein